MKLTILMYHKVAELPANPAHPGNYVSPADFARQLDALLAWGYRPITFDEWLAYRGGRGGLPVRPFIVTFDDGYRCFDTTAWPLLRERGIQPTMFLVAGQIGGSNLWDRDAHQEPLLDAERILALQREGVRFGSHSQTHVALGKVPAERALEEMTRSRRVLSDLLGSPVGVLSYPYSNQDRAVRDLARQAGYDAAVRGKGRMNFKHTDPHGLRRIKFDYGMSIEEVRRVLWRARWLRL